MIRSLRTVRLVLCCIACTSSKLARPTTRTRRKASCMRRLFRAGLRSLGRLGRRIEVASGLGGFCLCSMLCAEGPSVHHRVPSLCCGLRGCARILWPPGFCLAWLRFALKFARAARAAWRCFFSSAPKKRFIIQHVEISSTWSSHPNILGTKFFSS